MLKTEAFTNHCNVGESKHLILKARQNTKPVMRSALFWNFTWLSLAIRCQWFRIDIKRYITPITGPEGPRRFPDYVTMAQDGGMVVSLMHWPFLPPGNTPGTHFC